MPDKIFFDTNILIYLSNEDSPYHSEAEVEFERILKTKAEVWISRQVLREYAVVMTKPDSVEKPLSSEEVIEDLRKWQKIFNLADENKSVTKKLISLIKKYDIKGKRIHDVNIVATMIVNSISTIFTYNSGDFRTFKEIQVYGKSEEVSRKVRGQEDNKKQK